MAELVANSHKSAVPFAVVPFAVVPFAVVPFAVVPSPSITAVLTAFAITTNPQLGSSDKVTKHTFVGSLGQS